MCPNSHEIILDFCNSVDIFLTYITFSFMVQNKLLLLLHPFNSYISRTTWVSWYQKGKTSLDLNKAKDDRVSGCSGISWTICKQSAPRCRQITSSLNFYRSDTLPEALPTLSKALKALYKIKWTQLQLTTTHA